MPKPYIAPREERLGEVLLAKIAADEAAATAQRRKPWKPAAAATDNKGPRPRAAAAAAALPAAAAGAAAQGPRRCWTRGCARPAVGQAPDDRRGFCVECFKARPPRKAGI